MAGECHAPSAQVSGSQGPNSCGIHGTSPASTPLGAGNCPTYNGPDAGPAIGLDGTVCWGNGYPHLGLGIASTTFYAFSVNGK
jgi:hypothetical protein